MTARRRKKTKRKIKATRTPDYQHYKNKLYLTKNLDKYADVIIE